MGQSSYLVNIPCRKLPIGASYFKAVEDRGRDQSLIHDREMRECPISIYDRLFSDALLERIVSRSWAATLWGLFWQTQSPSFSNPPVSWV